MKKISAGRRSWRQVLNGEWYFERRNHQGWYGECFVQALAGAAGLQMGKPYPDVTGIDYDFTLTWEVDGDFPCLKAQVKSWSAPKLVDGFWKYRGLTEKQFNALAGQRRVPRYLFVVIVPEDLTTFIHADKHRLQLKQAAYWISLADRERIAGARADRKVEVLIPEDNLLTVDRLLGLLDPGRVVEAL
ncbi:DUF4365 domain-containing protein [Nonomuraea typhae]|uniref:DUF4365 domain-containing protein n=1 Tax=Nonomuraea typhae TaxID=2603600 RepID=UPI0012FB6B18|nr:DUF4365 domain-containing protein [Nonomuraea typhae]